MTHINAKLKEYMKTKSIATAAEICDELIEDMQQAARELYSEPIIEGEA